MARTRSKYREAGNITVRNVSPGVIRWLEAETKRRELRSVSATVRMFLKQAMSSPEET